MNYAAKLWHTFYKSNFYSKDYSTQLEWQRAVDELLSEYKKELEKNDQRS